MWLWAQPGEYLWVYCWKKWSWCWIFRLTWMCQMPVWAVVPSDRTPRGEVRDKWICGCCTASMWKAPLINRHNTSRLHRFLFIFNVVFIEYLHTSMRPFSLIPYFFSVSAAWELLLLCKCRVWTGFIVWSSLSPVCNIPGCVCWITGWMAGESRRGWASRRRTKGGGRTLEGKVVRGCACSLTDFLATEI